MTPTLPFTDLDINELVLPLTCERHSTRLARARKVVDVVADALAHDTPLLVYAQTKYGMWYKVYFFTRYGVLKSDTSGESLDNARASRAVIRSQGLTPVTLDACMQNWQTHGLYEKWRPLSTKLLALWQETHTISSKGVATL